MTVIVKHNKTNTITDWTQAQLNEQIALGNFPPGTTLANIVLPSDWNNDHTLTGLGTMAEQDATAVAITGGTINNTTIGATTATTGKFTSVTTPSVTATTLDLALNSASTGSVNFSSAGGQLFKISDGGAYGGYWNAFSASGSPSLRAIGNVSGAIDTNSAVPIQFRTNLGSSGAEQFRVGHTASAVNYVQVTGAATGGFVAISAQGSDSNPGIYYTTKGFGSHRFTTNTGGGSEQFRIITNSASTVNFLQVNGSATTLAPQFSAQGTDTNISMAFQPKGTGAIDLAAGSSGVNISNGGTVTALTRTAAGSGYSSPPTVAISAPTTAGGVQATATVTIGLVSVTSVANGGTGYTVGNVLTVVGGTFTVACQVTVTAVSSGVITSASVTTGGSYTVAPTNPVSVTGGSGSGATFNLSFCIGSTFTITNAGSGYIEQPTVTFSGGGGSGAAAYASVGNTATVKGLYGGGSQIPIQFAGPSGNLLQIMESGNTSAPTPLVIKGGSSSTQLYANLSNSSIQFSSNGTGGINFYTNTLAAEQLRVAHTASAVNYVQVTGSATGGQPTISAQGSDANVILNVASKNNSPILFFANGSEQFRAGQTGTAVNSLVLSGATAGLGPSISSRGSDTNINLNFATKGTGGLIFYTNNGANAQFQILDRASSVNYFATRGAAAGASPTLSVVGSDTDINLSLVPKGTGRVQFGTYTGTILTPTGYVEIVDSGGTVRRLLVG